jgi:DNA modification methylase
MSKHDRGASTPLNPSLTSSPPPGDRTLVVESWPLERLKAYKRNPRVHGAESVAKIAASISEFGFKIPVLVSAKGKLIAGHGRLLAARRLGLAEVPVIVCGDLSPAQVKALRIADNRSAEASTWDAELLTREIEALLDLDYDIDVLGFDPDEVSAILAEPTEGLTDPDEVPVAPRTPVTRLGDLWLLGEHRLLCGDATKAVEVIRLMGGKHAALMATDPPYLVDYEGGTHPASKANKGAAKKDKHWDAYIDHEHSVAFYADFLKVACEHALKRDAAVYQWFGIMRTEVIWEAWREVGLLPHQVLIWKKTRAVLTYSHYLWNYEPMMYGWPQGHMPAMKPPADARAVWEIASKIEDGPQEHATCKPVETIRRPIEYHTKPGGLLYEPFSGSGTATIAAEQTGRVCYAMELAPAYVDVAVERWQAFTGKQAVRHG